ncbi:hypothetical protein EDD93_1407 [Streptomyces sp. 840.1]|uniref:hypothetical protein n=1 Tax=Streptomyces sp. 840.1 TaxID=2485152 RepID=UPI000F479031|nr:hypothetical protein [Streptomyces sp. 840.1]ROQ66989.1 hypothetical protein EDD93_1407 [Streptomyces sp. 840.1]
MRPELVVLVTEPCIAKAHSPAFAYYRDGRLITAFSFETLSHSVGDEPGLLTGGYSARPSPESKSSTK